MLGSLCSGVYHDWNVQELSRSELKPRIMESKIPQGIIYCTSRTINASTINASDRLHTANSVFFHLPHQAQHYNHLCDPEQQFSTFLMLQPLNSVPRVVVTLTIKLFLLLLHHCNCAAVMNSNGNVWYLQRS